MLPQQSVYLGSNGIEMQMGQMTLSIKVTIIYIQCSSDQQKSLNKDNAIQLVLPIIQQQICISYQLADRYLIFNQMRHSWPKSSRNILQKTQTNHCNHQYLAAKIASLQNRVMALESTQPSSSILPRLDQIQKRLRLYQKLQKPPADQSSSSVNGAQSYFHFRKSLPKYNQMALSESDSRFQLQGWPVRPLPLINTTNQALRPNPFAAKTYQTNRETRSTSNSPLENLNRSLTPLTYFGNNAVNSVLHSLIPVKQIKKCQTPFTNPQLAQILQCIKSPFRNSTDPEKMIRSINQLSRQHGGPSNIQTKQIVVINQLIQKSLTSLKIVNPKALHSLFSVDCAKCQTRACFDSIIIPDRWLESRHKQITIKNILQLLHLNPHQAHCPHCSSTCKKALLQPGNVMTIILDQFSAANAYKIFFTQLTTFGSLRYYLQSVILRNRKIGTYKAIVKTRSFGNSLWHQLDKQHSFSQLASINPAAGSDWQICVVRYTIDPNIPKPNNIFPEPIAPSFKLLRNMQQSSYQFSSALS